MSGITWLHLSDWHQKGIDFDRRVVRDALIRDIEKRTDINFALSKIDFIVFSGDMAFSGKPEEYTAAKVELLEPILKAAGLSPDKLFVVPGNHDLDRNKLDIVLKGLLKLLDPYEQVKEWLDDGTSRVKVLEPFQAFTDFVTDYTHLEHPNYASTKELVVDGKRVALLGINSAWTCGRDNDDKGSVFIGEPQIYDSLKKILNADIKIAVIHHPFDWLNRTDFNHVRDRLMKDCDFILQGHQHKSGVEVTQSSSGSYTIIPAGACYSRRTEIDPRYISAYNFTNLDIDSGNGIVFFRRWSENRGVWVEDIDSYDQGKFEFILPKIYNQRRKEQEQELKLLSQNFAHQFITPIQAILSNTENIITEYQELGIKSNLEILEIAFETL
ncbi:MAG: metallophosphoesterase family protein, partial [Methanothrix sp.]